MNKELEGKVAIVTGAAGGFGRELVRGLLGAGAKVAALDVDDKRLDELAATHAEASGAGRLITARTDISRYEACEAAVAQARANLGGLHILINNGALGMGVIRIDHMTELVEIHEITPEMWDRFVTVNLSGAWYMTRAAIDGLLDQGWGRIVNVTTSFFTMLRGKFHPYGPAKAGLEAMSAGHASEFEGRGVTVNVVVPGGPCGHPDGARRSRFRPEYDDPAVGYGAANPVALLRGGRRAYRTSLRRRGLGRCGWPGSGGTRLPRPDRVAGSGPEPSMAGRQTTGMNHPFQETLDGTESQREDGARHRGIEGHRTRLRRAVRGRGREPAPYRSKQRSA